MLGQSRTTIYFISRRPVGGAVQRVADFDFKPHKSRFSFGFSLRSSEIDPEQTEMARIIAADAAFRLLFPSLGKTLDQ